VIGDETVLGAPVTWAEEQWHRCLSPWSESGQHHSRARMAASGIHNTDATVECEQGWHESAPSCRMATTKGSSLASPHARSLPSLRRPPWAQSQPFGVTFRALGHVPLRGRRPCRRLTARDVPAAGAEADERGAGSGHAVAPRVAGVASNVLPGDSRRDRLPEMMRACEVLLRVSSAARHGCRHGNACRGMPAILPERLVWNHRRALARTRAGTGFRGRP